MIEKFETKWNEKFNTLKDYLKKNGRYPIFDDIKGDEELTSLYNWVKNQRYAYENHTLSDERTEKLNSINFDWKPTKLNNKTPYKWKDKFYLLNQYIKENNTLPECDTIYYNCKLGEWFFNQIEKFEFGKLPKDKEEKFFTIYHLLEEKHTKWNEYFDILKEYVDEKNALPNAKETYKSVDIGKWFLTQKTRYKNNLLNAEKEKMLESLSIPFSAGMTVDPKIWETQYNIYRSYYDIYQKEPSVDVVIENLNLSNWQYAQKLLIKRDRLSKEQEELLRKVGITATKYKDIWFDNFELLKKYFLEYNREPERKTVYENFSLGRWYYKQKDAYEDNKLSDEQKEVFKTFINDVECKSISKYDAIWLEHYENLKLYIEKNGKYPQKDDSTDIAFKKLYNWMISQRHLYRANKLSQYRIDKLNEINFVWKNEDISNGYEQKWQANFIKLSAFFEVYGRLPICSDIKEPEIGKLYFWVNDQRKAYKNGLLKPERLEQLRSIGLDFEAPETDMNAFEKKWDKFFSLLRDYIKENGTVPMSNTVYKDSFLGNWYSAQLRSYRKGTLSKDRIQKFWNAKIPMISAGEQKRLNNWFMYYNTYLAFLKEYKRIPRYKERINGFALYKWGYAQVDLLKHNKLNDIQREMLKKIGITENGISIDSESIIDENIVLNSETIINKSVNDNSSVGFDMNFMGVNLSAEYNVNDEGYEIHQLPMEVTGKEMSVSEFLEEFNNFVGEDKLTEEGVKEKIKKNYPIILWNDKDNFFDSIKFVLKRVYFDIRVSNTGEVQTVNIAYNFSFLLRGRNSNIPNLTPFKVNNLKFNVCNPEI